MGNKNAPQPKSIVPPPQSLSFDPKILIEILSAKWKDKKCPMCDSGPWNIGNEIFELRPFYGGNLILGPSTILPVIPVTCGNCGHTLFINAVQTGLVKKEGK
jgi:hypothetical protein